MGDAIVRRAGGSHQRCELDEGIDRYEDGTRRQRSTRDAIGHPDRHCGRSLIVLTQPHLAALPHAALDENRLAMLRMPRIVNGDLLSVVGGM